MLKAAPPGLPDVVGEARGDALPLMAQAADERGHGRPVQDPEGGGFFVSVTRARVRRVWDLPFFAVAAFGALEQAKSASGFVGGSVCPDRHRTFWTLTVWRSEEAMRAYVLSGAHHKVMHRFAQWCDEASVVNWRQADGSIPPWTDAVSRMRLQGRPSKVRRPSPNHQTLSFDAPRLTSAAPISAVCEN